MGAAVKSYHVCFVQAAGANTCLPLLALFVVVQASNKLYVTVRYAGAQVSNVARTLVTHTNY